MKPQTKFLRLIWAAVRRIPDGEDALRVAVGDLNDRDGTNQDVKGSKEYFSTKRLTFEQLGELADRFRKRANLPRVARAPGPRGGVRRPAADDPARMTYLASDGQKTYIDHLFETLGFSPETRKSFIERQTKGAGLVTNRACQAVITPLERMARGRGYTITQVAREKRLVPPAEPAP